MSRHIVDRRKSPEGGRLKNFVEVEKTHGEDGAHPAAKALHERPVTRNDSAKLREYLRIERGQTA
ncbi:hypothetical protein QKW60_17830 [Defluviimonas aestuarii]|uniref:hypothetical protein n=1 Tax=Albidovulum aestuarii TaxID=1130726 RepID=UPI00249C1CF6|nr:hypothetical protein [Defluviimonas aestuarii]MDI3338274.1 hypothetical protein [Defluviimonas aestuarii]